MGRVSVEAQIIGALQDSGGTAEPDIILEKLGLATAPDDVQGVMQSLYDRGEVELTHDWKLHKK